MHTSAVAMNVGVAVDRASGGRGDPDRGVDAAGLGLFGGQGRDADADRTVPLSLAGEGRATNIQNELGEEIRSSKSTSRREPRGGALGSLPCAGGPPSAACSGTSPTAGGRMRGDPKATDLHRCTDA